MALEIIKNIAEAEKKSENIKTQALQDSEQLKIDAENNGKEFLIKARKESKTRATNTIQSAIESVQQQVNTILSEADNNCADIKSIASKKMSEAVNGVIEKVVGIDGNS